MKRDSLKIGARSKSKREQFEAQFNAPESLAECAKALGEPAVYRFAMRGYRIWLQDAIGRPMFEAGASSADIQKALDVADPRTTKAVGRPKVQPSVKIPSGKKSFTQEEVLAMMNAQGFKVTAE